MSRIARRLVLHRKPRLALRLVVRLERRLLHCGLATRDLWTCGKQAREASEWSERAVCSRRLCTRDGGA